MNIRSVGKVALYIIFLVLLAGGSFGTYIGYYFVRLYHNAINYEAARMPIDLATQGEYTCAFNQKYLATYGKQFRFIVNPSFSSEEQMHGALKDLKTHILIINAAGEKILDEDITLQNFLEDDSPDCRWYIPMQDFTPYVFFREFDAIGKNSRLKLTVISPAILLKGKTQQLVVKNVLCRTESLNVYTGWAFIVTGSIAALAGIFGIVQTARIVIKKQKRSLTPSASDHC